MADLAHAADQGMAAEELLVRVADELTAAIGMQDHLVAAFALPYGHLNRANHHVAILPVMHRPSHDELAVEVEDDAEMEFPWGCLNFCV
jgi:hypothetical protein